VYKVLVGKAKGKSPIGRPKRRWDGIKMDLSEIGWGGVVWIHLAQDRDCWQAFVSVMMNVQILVLWS
jgi:hypothetical protein